MEEDEHADEKALELENAMVKAMFQSSPVGNGHMDYHRDMAGSERRVNRIRRCVRVYVLKYLSIQK